MGEFRKYQPPEYAPAENLRLDEDWKRLLDEGFAYAGVEALVNLQRGSDEREADEARGLTTNADELQDAGFEMQLARAYLNGDPVTKQVLNDKMAIFIKPHEWADEDVWGVYRGMCASQGVTPVEKPETE